MLLTTGLIALLATTEPAVALPIPGSALPAVSTGSNPYRYVFGEFSGSELQRDVLVVPADQDFIVTAFAYNSSGVSLLRDGEVVLDWEELGLAKHHLSSGSAKLRFAGGSTIQVRRKNTDYYYPYFVQGYFVASGSPHRFQHGRTGGGGPRDIWTAASDSRDFMVRSLLTDTGWCDFSLDGTRISHSSWPFGGPGTREAFAAGRGMLVIPAGSTLSVEHGMGGDESCAYYLEGEYIQP